MLSVKTNAAINWYIDLEPQSGPRHQGAAQLKAITN